MTRKPVKSSQIAAIGYDPTTTTLEIEFQPNKKQREAEQPGSVYQYSNVPSGEAVSLLGAESIGAHFGKVIKPFPEQFPFKKIELEA